MEFLRSFIECYSRRSVDMNPNIFRNDKNIISSISVADIVFDEYLRKWNYRAIPKVKT